MYVQHLTKLKWTHLRLNPKVIMNIKNIITVIKNIILTTKNITMAIKKNMKSTWWIFFCLVNQSFSSSFSFTSLGARMLTTTSSHIDLKVQFFEGLRTTRNLSGSYTM